VPLEQWYPNLFCPRATYAITQQLEGGTSYVLRWFRDVLHFTKSGFSETHQFYKLTKCLSNRMKWFRGRIWPSGHSLENMSYFEESLYSASIERMCWCISEAYKYKKRCHIGGHDDLFNCTIDCKKHTVDLALIASRFSKALLQERFTSKLWLWYKVEAWKLT